MLFPKVNFNGTQYDFKARACHFRKAYLSIMDKINYDEGRNICIKTTFFAKFRNTCVVGCVVGKHIRVTIPHKHHILFHNRQIYNHRHDCKYQQLSTLLVITFFWKFLADLWPQHDKLMTVALDQVMTLWYEVYARLNTFFKANTKAVNAGFG